ncbi:MAG: hypothetical protein AB7S26_35645 [Sandaracinaceae bacterium]
MFALLLGGCINIDFDPPQIIMTKRILGISANPPEAAFGEDIVFEVLAVDELGNDLASQPGVTMQWYTCVSLAEIFGGAGLGAGVDLSDTCAEGGPDLIALETDGLPPGQARLPGAAILALATMLQGAGMGMGGELPPGVTMEQLMTLLTVITVVGVPLSVSVDIYVDNQLVERGRKRFAITTREDPTTSPPPPRFSIDGHVVSARSEDSDDPRVCASLDGDIRVAPATDIVLSPADDEEEWLDDYPVYNLTGDLQINHEAAFYNWFSTGGEFSREATMSGDHDVTWTTPEDAGTYPVYVVVRDGHLGTSWCRANVIVN